MTRVALLSMFVAMIAQLAGEQAQPLQPETGTLAIDAQLPVGSIRGDYFEAGWLFIDGRLLGRLPQKRSVTLQWGAHNVKVVVGAYTDQKPRYFTVSWPRFFMNRGATQTLVMGPAIESAINGEPLQPGMEYVASPGPPGPPELAATDFAKVEEAYAALRKQQAPARTLWIALSEGRGGPREVDADQLRFLMRTLRLDPPSASFDDRVTATIRELIGVLETRRQ